MKVTLYTLPAAGAAPLPIPALQMTRLLEVIEDDAAAAQGIIVFLPGDNYTQPYTVSNAHQPFVRGNRVGIGDGRGTVLGHAAQIVKAENPPGTVIDKVLRPADIYLKATSATATPTKVRVTEFD